MKTSNLIMLFLLLSIILGSCRKSKSPDVIACFKITSNSNYAGQKINFANCSSFANSYTWDFGDGSSSRVVNPSHTYNNPGTYTVQLTAFGDGGKSIESKDVIIDAVQLTTDLDILVKYLGTNDIATNCEVTIYKSEDDWFNFENPVATAYTNNEGIVVFSNLNPIVYYIDAYKKVSDTSYYCNELLGVATEPLEEGKVNYYDIYIEYLITNKKSKRHTNKSVLIKNKSLRISD